LEKSVRVDQSSFLNPCGVGGEIPQQISEIARFDPFLEAVRHRQPCGESTGVHLCPLKGTGRPQTRGADAEDPHQRNSEHRGGRKHLEQGECSKVTGWIVQRSHHNTSTTSGRPVVTSSVIFRDPLFGHLTIASNWSQVPFGLNWIPTAGSWRRLR